MDIITTANFVDIHSHLVNNIDDGSSSLDESKFLIKNASDLGVKKILCTPHFYYQDLRYDEEMFNKNFDILNSYSNSLGVKLYKGSECLLTCDLLNAIYEKKVLTINDTKYILIELKRNNKLNMDEITSLVEELKKNNLIPVLAHPEFNNILFKNIKNIKTLFDLGVIIQVDASSLLKRNSRYSFVKKLIKKDLVHIVASDVHNKYKNYDDFYNSYINILRKFGDTKANLLYSVNPNKIIEGEKI